MTDSFVYVSLGPIYQTRDTCVCQLGDLREMGIIRPSTSLLALLYCSFLAFTLAAVYSFSSLYTGVSLKLLYGIGLLVIACASLLTGLTSAGSAHLLQRAFQLCLVPLWGSVGAYHIAQCLDPGLSQVDALVPGYSSFLLLFVAFLIIALWQKDVMVVVLSLCMSLSCIFEIASIWQPLNISVGSYYILLASGAAYCVVNELVHKKQGKKQDEPSVDNMAQDYAVIGQALNCTCAAVFASQVTNATSLSSHAFMWILVSAIIQIIIGVVSVRRKSVFYGFIFCFYGTFWLNIGYTLAVNRYMGLGSEPLLTLNICLVLMLAIISAVSASEELLLGIQSLAFVLFSIATCLTSAATTFRGVAAWLLFVVSFYGFVAYVLIVSTLLKKLPLGKKLLETAQIRQYITSSICKTFLFGKVKNVEKGSFTVDTMLGYSKYANLDAVGFLANCITCLAFLWVPVNSDLLILPWVIGLGGVVQLTVGIISFSRGKTFEGCAFLVFSCLWLIWGSVGSLGVSVNGDGVTSCAGLIGFLTVGFLLWLISAMVNKAWFALTFMFELVGVAFLLEKLQVSSHGTYESVVMFIFALVNLYMFLATALGELRHGKVLLLGGPLFNVSYLHAHGTSVTWAKARGSSGVQTIADILNDGGICGVPSDVVYVLVAACKFPAAVERAYKTKKQAEDRPMSMWISRIDQLSAGREEFGELLWSFMSKVWPSTISIVVNKGPWMESLGIGYAEKYIGRPDSIAIRMPDNTITSYLIDKTGPVAVSSANPTGEADTTHHLQVMAKLGPKNCDGILCDGPSHENAASTVVDCRKINEGKLGFFRIGIVPKSHVLEIFEEVKREQVPTGSQTRDEFVEAPLNKDITYKHLDEVNNTSFGDATSLTHSDRDTPSESAYGSESGIINTGFESSTENLFDPESENKENRNVRFSNQIQHVADITKF